MAYLESFSGTQSEYILNQLGGLLRQSNDLAREVENNTQKVFRELSNIRFVPPVVSANISAPDGVVLADPPPVPEISIPELNAGVVPDPSIPGLPSDLNIDTDAPPSLVLPERSAPEINIGVAPTVPEAREIVLPTAPEIGDVPQPNFLPVISVAAPILRDFSLLENRLFDIPEMEILEPASFSHVVGEKYTSPLLSALRTALNSRLNGGTGLAPHVEQAIWDRARSREDVALDAEERQLIRDSESLGFRFPPGVTAARVVEARDKRRRALSELSINIAVKQAELEQRNLEITFSQIAALEAKFIDHTTELERLAFETAKAYADNAVQIYNGRLEKFKTLMLAYSTLSEVYKAAIQSQLADVEIYKSKILAEETKANINRALVEQYKAMVDAGLARVEVYKSIIEAKKAEAEIEQTKIAIAGERIKAYVAQTNAEIAKVDAFKAVLEGDATKAQIYKTSVDAYAAKVKARSEVISARISAYSAELEAAKTRLSAYIQQQNVAVERFRAIVQGEIAKTDVAKARAEVATKINEANIKLYEAKISYNEAVSNLALNASKVTAEMNLQAQLAKADSFKGAAQVYSQLLSSAFGVVRGSISVNLPVQDLPNPGGGGTD